MSGAWTPFRSVLGVLPHLRYENKHARGKIWLTFSIPKNLSLPSPRIGPKSCSLFSSGDICGVWGSFLTGAGAGVEVAAYSTSQFETILLCTKVSHEIDSKTVKWVYAKGDTLCCTTAREGSCSSGRVNLPHWPWADERAS